MTRCPFWGVPGIYLDLQAILGFLPLGILSHLPQPLLQYQRNMHLFSKFLELDLEEFLTVQSLLVPFIGVCHEPRKVVKPVIGGL
jgi:hypothetical protein